MSRELDREVAEKVFGYKPIVTERGVSILLGHDDCPHYSTDIADTWLVVEKLRDLGWGIQISDWVKPGNYNVCVARYHVANTAHWGDGKLPEAICRAAKKAVESSHHIPFPAPAEDV